MWVAVLTAVLVVLALLVLALLAPARVRVRATLEDALDGEVEVRWLGLRKRFPLRPRGPPGPRERTRRRFAPQAGFLGEVRALLARLRRHVRLDELDARLRVGAGDAADTGRLLGVLAPLCVVAAALPRASLVVEPAWGEARVRGAVRAAWRAVPLVILVLALRFLAARPVRRTLRATRRRGAA